MSILVSAPVTTTSHSPTLGAREDAWSQPDDSRADFLVEADAEPESLIKVLNFFALQCLLPTRVSSDVRADRLMLAIRQDGLSAHRARVIAAKLRSLVCVADVQLHLDDER